MLTPKRKLMTAFVFRQYWKCEDWQNVQEDVVDPKTGKEYNLSEFMDTDTLERYLNSTFSKSKEAPMDVFFRHFIVSTGNWEYKEEGEGMQLQLELHYRKRFADLRTPRGWDLGSFLTKFINRKSPVKRGAVPTVSVNKDVITLKLTTDCVSELSQSCPQVDRLMLLSILLTDIH